MSVFMFCVAGGSLGLHRHLSTSSSNHSLVTGCMIELHTPACIELALSSDLTIRIYNNIENGNKSEQGCI